MKENKRGLREENLHEDTSSNLSSQQADKQRNERLNVSLDREKTGGRERDEKQSDRKSKGSPESS